MNREQIRNRASGRIEKIRLDDGSAVDVRPLSALDRARIYDRYREIRTGEGEEQSLETLTRTQCFIISRALVDDAGALLYQDANEINEELISEDFPDDVATIAQKILVINKMAVPDNAEKNLQPTPSGDSNSD